MRYLGWALAVCALLTTRPALADRVDPVAFWTDQLLNGIRAVEMAPTLAARDVGMVETAMYNAVNAADGDPYSDYHFSSAVTGADADAAAFQAGWHMINDMFPTLAAKTDAAAQIYGSAAGFLTPSDASLAAGMQLGSAAAEAMAALRANDGTAAPQPIDTGSTATGMWRPTPPGYSAAVTPGWGNVTLYVLSSSSQFEPAPPPAVGTPAYDAAVLQVQCVGGATAPSGTLLSACQGAGILPTGAAAIANTLAADHATAVFWSDDPDGTYKPPGQLVQTTLAVAQSQGLDMMQESRLLALVGTALNDSAIATWQAKYAYDFWRPITAINSATDPDDDPSWIPYLQVSGIDPAGTPAFPSYTSGHAGFAGAWASVMDDFFGTDTMSFSVSSDTSSEIRSFTSFDAAAQEEADSRTDAGVHFSFDSAEGLTLGNDVGDYVFDNAFQSIPAPPSLSVFGVALGGLILLQSRAQRRRAPA